MAWLRLLYYGGVWLAWGLVTGSQPVHGALERRGHRNRTFRAGADMTIDRPEEG